MDVTKMMQVLPESTHTHIFMLLEGGARTQDAFQAFYNEHASALYSLYLYPHLAEFRNYGPWLFALKNKETQHRYIDSTPGLTAVIASSRSGGALAVQLSAACTIISPNGAAALVRFYTRDVMSLLASRNDREWHSVLFRGVSQWWAPEENGWHPVDIPPSLVINERDSAIRLNKEEWQYLADEPVVTSLLTAWKKLPSSQHFSPCVQRNMVKKALKKACEGKMKAGTEQKLYALFYLDGGKITLASGTMQSALENVALGKVSLEQV
ncbi:TPA: DUF4123 domain-containing protein [Enterobacter chengduensis]|uniref:DUF4123 domain-containing protein n=1 Tax=Enterobacter chengduensis TaxID=2494701 RepID=A0AAW3HAZ1_9ENTR|nr:MULTISPECIES: DUF4123 domain-containing protein [Enterobacter cloacae complex]KDF38788.1 hypothetical protein AE07_04664 [Enterobacter cloacae BWH 43]OTW34559.1 hypothetical protein CAP57_12990 [Enterobacter kobei]GJL43232.1 hypothetical protein TUM17577_44410 [Enterobacter asburiae]KJX30648.1 hypothetical protein SG71_21565 [Enterobacter chengduensis]MBN9880467.1 DUF4123 domain-containing protein [Enterobacter chengduensis]